jgi:hypothetical protein
MTGTLAARGPSRCSASRGSALGCPSQAVRALLLALWRGQGHRRDEVDLSSWGHVGRQTG